MVRNDIYKTTKFHKQHMVLEHDLTRSFETAVPHAT